MFSSRTARTLALATALGVAVPAAGASAATLTGVDTSNRLLTFSSSSPKKIAKTTAISGLTAGDRIVGLDRRPANSSLYAIGSSSTIYRVDITTGKATVVGSGPLATKLFGTGFGWDFNPTVDRIRLTSNFTQNLRLHPDTGAVAATDKSLNYATGDANAGKVATVVGSAYTNNVMGATTTQLLNIDSTTDSLVLQDPPNDGGLKTIGTLGAGDVTNPVAFDISAAGEAFATLKVKRRVGTLLYRVNVTTGKATKIGRIGATGAPRTLVGLTVIG
ncbi:hypothetical protein DSM112329_01275 [Paraconexibacter sp. AEG42_29]|uniref:DUF4394 domain-containing protein n=1 Tax=Paraconexibacter sp. AEG42_29 TaxID=2997339 RepID=A0AAU7AS52_9ACTN